MSRIDCVRRAFLAATVSLLLVAPVDEPLVHAGPAATLDDRQTSTAQRGSGDEASALDTESGGSSIPTGLIVGLAVVTGVLVFGLNAVRRQRASGRTSKFPRIG